MTEPEEIVENLTILSENEIAQLLKDNDIKGKRNNKLHCPIANYLDIKTGDNWAVDSTLSNLTRNFHYVPSLSIAYFMKNFDRGYYPELEEDKC